MKIRKILTFPSKCIYPTQDNEDGNLVLAKGDYIYKPDGSKYMAIELLGTGCFGQVFRCISDDGDEVAIKVVKAKNKYFQYEMNEVRILKRIKEQNLNDYFIELYDAFIYKQHLCIVLELLGRNMFAVTKILQFQGLRYSFLKVFLRQLLQGLCYLHNQGIIHCDLKPENILIQNPFTFKIKIIDFGSSTTKALSSTFYIQSRFYRAPEVILGISYSYAIDMWSFGCVAFEMFTGNPLFPGVDNKDQIYKIHEFFPSGLPHFMLEHGKNTHLYFEKENNYKFTSSLKPFRFEDMKEAIYLHSGSMRDHDLFISFLKEALNPSYLERALPHTLLKHPFLDESPEMAPNTEKAIREGQGLNQIFENENKDRKMSMYDFRPFDADENSYKDVRKGSVFDPDHENRRNI